MDGIIFRNKTNRFARWSDGNIFFTGDTDEISDEMEKEKEFMPVALYLSYKTNEDGTETVTVHYGNMIPGVFVCDGTDEGFRKALLEFANKFEKDTENILQD